MTSEKLPESLYRGVKGSRAGTRATIVCALQYDGSASTSVDAEHVSWTPRAASLLRALGQEGNDSGLPHGASLPFTSLRAAIATAVPEAFTLERDLGAPWAETPRAFLDVDASDDLRSRLGQALSLWAALALRPWAEAIGASEEIVDSLHELEADAFVVSRRDATLLDVLGSAGSFAEARDAIVQRFASALEGRELFEGLGPVWRIVRGRSASNEVEFVTWPAVHEDAMYSMVAGIAVETIPFSHQPIVTVRASRRRWLASVPSGRALTGQRNVTVTLMGRAGSPAALEVSAPVRSLEVQDPMAPEFLGQLLRVGDDVAVPLADLVARGAGGPAFVGVAYSSKLGGSHPIGAGVSTRDQTDLFDAVQECVDAIGFVPVVFEETSSLKRAPKRSSESHKALEVEALLSDVAVSIGRNDLDDDASIEAAWKSMGLEDDTPAIEAVAAAKARERLADVRRANIERVSRVFGDRTPSVVVIARTEGERRVLQTVLESLFGASLQVTTRPLPADVHGPRASLPASDGKTRQRFEVRVAAWRPLAQVLSGIGGGCHALVQATDWYDRRPDDPVNKLAGRYALASEANANVQYLRPRESGQRGFANYLHRLQAAIYDLVFGHAGLVSEVAGVVAATFSDVQTRPTSVIGISVLTQARTRLGGKSAKLCLATRIDCVTGRTSAKVGWHDGEMRWSAAWEPLFEMLKRIASPSISASLGSGIAVERASFQAFVREILDDCAEEGDRPLVMLNSTGAAGLWPWLTDTQVGVDITLGSEQLDVSRRWPGIRLVRIRLGHAARIAERKTADYERVDTSTGGDVGEVLERYCPTVVARTVRLSSMGAGSGHYWSTAGYFQMSLPRGLSVYRKLVSLVPVAKAFPEAPLPPAIGRLFVPVGIPIFDVSYRLPNPIEVTVAVLCEGDDPDSVAHLVASLREGYGHTASSTSLPAPLSFESKARDYMTRFALDVTDEEDEVAAEVGVDTCSIEQSEAADDVPDLSNAPVQATGPLAWQQLVDGRGISLMDSTSLASAQIAMSHEFGLNKGHVRMAAERTHKGTLSVVEETENSVTPEWSELAPVIGLPEFVTLEWLSTVVNVPNAQLRALHLARAEIQTLSGFAGWPDVKPDLRQFLAILLEGLRYPRFAAAVTQFARRSLPAGKRETWSPFKSLWNLAWATGQRIQNEGGASIGSLRTQEGLIETLASAGEVDLAMWHIFRIAYSMPLESELISLIDADARFEPIKGFVADARNHLFRSDYEWDGDLRRFPAAPTKSEADTGEGGKVGYGPSALSSELGEADAEPMDAVDDECRPNDAVVAHPVADHEHEAVREAAGLDASKLDGEMQWGAALAAIVAEARGAAGPDPDILVRITGHLEDAASALAQYDAARPKDVEATTFVARAREALALALGVLSDAEEEDALPAMPTGPFATTVTADIAASLKSDLDTLLGTANSARTSIAEAQRILRDVQMARLQDAIALKTQAVADGRAVAAGAARILESLLVATSTDDVVGSDLPTRSEGLDIALDQRPPLPAGREVIDPDDSIEMGWDAFAADEEFDGHDSVAYDEELASQQVLELVETVVESIDPALATEADPVGPLLLTRFSELVASREFGLAYHLSQASAAAALYDDFPVSLAELRLAAIAGHVNHAAQQGSQLVHDLLVDAHGTFERMDDDTPDAVARRIIAVAALAPFALYHNDPEAKLALEALRQVADGLGEEVHAFREALFAPAHSGLTFSPAQMRLAGEEAQEDEHARSLAARILSDLDDFAQKPYKFQLGNKLRNVLSRNDGELGRLRERVARGGKAALDATRDFADAYNDRSSTLSLLEAAEVRVGGYRLTGIDGIARERMLGLIQGIVSVCSEYVETADAAPAMKGTRVNVQRARAAIVDAIVALIAALERHEPADSFERAAAAFARKSLADFLRSVNGAGRTPAATDHLVAIHGPLLRLSALEFGRGWLPAPYAPEAVVGAILDSTSRNTEESDEQEAYKNEVRDRIAYGSHIPAAMLLSAADFYTVPAADAEALAEEREADVVTRRDALTAELRDARLLVDRLQRMGGVGTQDEAQSLLSLLDRISPEDLPSLVPLASRSEVPEAEQILDFKAAYGLVADVRTKVATLLKRPRDELLDRIAALAGQGSVSESDLNKVRGLVQHDDLLTATEYLGFLETGRALPETTSPNPRFHAYYPQIPELLAAMTKSDQERIVSVIEAGEEFAGLNFGRVPVDRRADVLEALDGWRELRRAVGAGRPDTDVAVRLARMLECFGLDVDIRNPIAKGNRRVYSADVRIELLRDAGSVLLPDFGSQTGGDYRLCVGTKMPSEAEMQAILADAGALRVIVFVTETISPERRNRLLLSCLDNSRRLLVIDESIIYFALSEPELRGLTLIELAQPFSFADPYRDFGNAAVPGEMFFGRAHEQRKLLEPHGSCIVYGGRRLGKTALLRHIQSESNDPEAGTAVAYVNIFEIGANAGEEQIWEYMSRELKAVFPKPVEHSERFSEAVRQWLDGDSKRRVLVLLDESDRFIQADAGRDFAQFVRLQRLMDDTNRRFKFVLAGLHNVTRLVHTENPPLKQIASDPQRIGPLMDEELVDAEALVTRPLAGMGHEFENREDVWRILSYCNYYPVLVQKFCQELVQELVREATGRRRPVPLISSDHIRLALENERIAKEIGETFDYTISKIEDRYSLIANIVADRALRDSAIGRIGEGMSAVEVRDAAASWWPAAFGEANRLAVVEDLLDEMEGLGVLRRVPPNRWALRSPTILRLLGHDEKIAAKLGEFMDRDAPPVFDPRSMRRRLKANPTMRVQDGAICPLTLGQEHDILRDRAPVTLVFGNTLSDIGIVTGALASVGQSRDERRVVEVAPRSFSSADTMVKELKGAPQDEAPILHIVHDASAWDVAWVEQALRVRAVRDGRARVLFVGRAEHALSWVLDPRSEALARELKIVPLQIWSTTLTDHMLQQEHLDPSQFRVPLRDATGGYNQLMHQLFAGGSTVTAKTFTARLQAAATRRRREPALPAELGLIGPMLDVFAAIAEYTDSEITPYEIGEGPVVNLGLDFSGHRVVEFGVLMGLLEAQVGGSAEAEDARPFRLNPLLSMVFGTGRAS